MDNKLYFSVTFYKCTIYIYLFTDVLVWLSTFLVLLSELLDCVNPFLSKVPFLYVSILTLFLRFSLVSRFCPFYSSFSIRLNPSIVLFSMKLDFDRFSFFSEFTCTFTPDFLPLCSPVR